jgi:SAM-dependent methyltransferase
VDVEKLYYAMDDRSPTHYSRAWSLVEDSDVVAAKAYLDTLVPAGVASPQLNELRLRMSELYPYLYGLCSFSEYYERYFVREDSKGARQRRSMVGNPRFEAIAAEVSKLDAEAWVVDYGCAEGVIILDLAARFPTRHFTGIDFAATNVALCKKYAAEMGLNNVEFYVGSTDEWPLSNRSDAVICSEVLEHVTEPWEVIGFLERQTFHGGRIIITVPMGPWEAIGLYDREQYRWRAHIWHVNKRMLRTMFADKDECNMSSLPAGAMPDGRALGHLLFTYKADHGPVHPVSPLNKAFHHRPRETVTAAMIVNNADMLMKTLKSIHNQVQVFKIHIHSDDPAVRGDIEFVVDRFMSDHPWVSARVIYGQKLEPGVYGFDDARNDSVKDIETDWVLWIDSDEYISGDFRKYLRTNAFDSYAISQHHFSCDPRGAPPQLDRPARLYRTNRGFTFYGKVHEHAEKGLNAGPGFAMMLGDVDIGHIGYVNEDTRRTRFSRNFPFLEWDNKVNSQRNLSKFLWLRDIVQRMRYHREIGDTDTAGNLARQAVRYYSEEWKDWTAPGMGGEAALQYHSEALAFLGRGSAVAFQIEMDGEKTTLSGVFESEEDVAKSLKDMLREKFKQRHSRYWA